MSKRQPKAFSTESESSDEDGRLSLEGEHSSSYSEDEPLGKDYNFSAFKNSVLSSRNPTILSSSSSTTTTTTPKLTGDDLIKAKIAQSHPIKSPVIPSTPEIPQKPLTANTSTTTTTTTTYNYPKIRKINNAGPTIYPTLASVVTNKTLEEEYQAKKKLLANESTTTPTTTTPLSCHNKNHHPNTNKLTNQEIREKDEKFFKNLRDTLGMPAETKTQMPSISFPHTQAAKIGQEKRFTFEDLVGEEGEEGESGSVPLSLKEKKKFGLIERLATQMVFEDQVQNSGVKSLMSMGKYAPIGAHWGKAAENKPCQATSVMTHIRQYHNEFFQLLVRQNLVEIIKGRIPGVVIVIPNPTALIGVDPTSEDTRTILLYHVLITNGISIQEVDGMVNYETLSGDYVQVESSNGVHYINGQLLIKPDVNCLFSIYHIDRIMDKGQVMEIDDSPYPPDDLPPPLPSTTTEEEDDPDWTEEEEEEEEGTVGGEEGFATKIETQFISAKICAAPRFTTSTESPLPLLEALTRGMSQQFFSAPIELPEHLVSLQTQPERSEIILSTFPTTELFKAYESNQMLPISRVKIASRFELSFSPSQHHHLGSPQLQLTQYVCPGGENREIRKMELSRGLLAVSLNSLDGKGFRTMLCKMECHKDDGNCYVSQDENLLLRFHEDKLDSITVNHANLSSLPIAATPLQQKSFFEYPLSSELYKSHMSRGQFDVMLLSQGKVGRWIKKQTQKSLRKSRCGLKRLEAINLKPILNSYIQSILVEKVNPQMDESQAQTVSATINLFDKSCHSLDSRSTQARRYSVVTKQGDPIVVHKLDISFSDESHLSRNTELFDRHHMIEIQMGAQKKLTIHLHGVNRKSTLYSYFGLVGIDLFVFTFDSLSGRLQYIYAMRAETIIGRKIKAAKAV